MKKDEHYPPLPLAEWEETKRTLHLYSQIVGKIRMNLMPKQNHWWHVPLYVETRGLSTRSIPLDGRRFEITFDIVDHKLRVTTSAGERESFDLRDGLSVASFYDRLFNILGKLDIEVEILAEPYDHESTIPFPDDGEHRSYSREHVERFWRILKHTDRVFKEFRGTFKGKSCPVQLYWHSFDLAVTFFSGRPGPEMPPEAGEVEREAYSHEVISFGFWPGDQDMREPAYYSYTYPAPEGIDGQPLEPEEAMWVEQNGSPMAVLRYEDVRESGDPAQTLYNFLHSAYRAGARMADWEV